MTHRLLCLSYVPTHPATAGNRSRIVEMLRALQIAGWEVDFLYQDIFAGSTREMREFWGDSFHYVPYRNSSLFHRGLRSLRQARRIVPWAFKPGFQVLNRFRNQSRSNPMNLDDWYDPALDQWLADRFSRVKYDAFMVEYFFASRALLMAPRSVRRVIDTHDVFALGGSDNLRAVKESWVWVEPDTELAGLRRADAVLAIQHAEAATLRQAGVEGVSIVGHFMKPQPCSREAALKSKEVLFVASSHRFNVEGLRWFHQAVFPLLKDILTPDQVVITGNIREILGRKLPFTFRGMLPDLRPAYESARMIISPILGGSGLKIKNVEAMAMGRTVVTTPCGAIGLESGAGKVFSVGSTPLEFANAIRALLADDSLCDARMRAGIQYVADGHSAHLKELEGALLGQSVT